MLDGWLSFIDSITVSHANNFMVISDLDMTLNERIENLEVVENFVMEEENTQYAPESPVAQSSSVVADESRHSGETKTPRSIVTGDESNFAIEMAVNEREDEFESAEEEQIVTGNDEDEDDDKEYEEPQPIAVIKASEYCLLCRARFPLFDCLNEANRNLYNDRLEENPNEPWQSQIRAGILTSQLFNSYTKFL